MPVKTACHGCLFCREGVRGGTKRFGWCWVYEHSVAKEFHIGAMMVPTTYRPIYCIDCNQRKEAPADEDKPAQGYTAGATIAENNHS